MALECPNCRAPVSFLRSVRTTAWGSFPCADCGSILGISLARRLLACGVWLGVMLPMVEFFQLYTWGRAWVYGGMFALLFVIVFLCEQIVLIERRAFTCRACGYDLQGLSEQRCPECETDFDPDEQARIQTRIDLPPPRPRRLVLLLLIFGLLTTSVLFGMRAWSRASRPPGAVPATASPAANPAPLNAP
jgi:hypothetical protein